MTYDDIRAQFTALLNRRDCTTTQRDAFITSAIQRIQRDLRCPAMEKIVDITVNSSYATTGGLIIPDDYLELIDLIPQQDGQLNRLEKADITRVLRLANQSSNIATMDIGIPHFYARMGGLWVLAPAPAVNDVIRCRYYAELSPLSAGTDTNPITVIAPDLIYYGALSYAGDYFTDKRTATWEGRYTQIKDDLNVMAETDEEDGASAVEACYDFPNDLGDLY